MQSGNWQMSECREDYPNSNSEFLAILPCRIVDDLIVWVFVSNISVRISVILTILLFSVTLHGLVQSIVHLYQVHGSSSCQSADLAQPISIVLDNACTG
jgi:hypothetical protein